MGISNRKKKTIKGECLDCKKIKNIRYAYLRICGTCWNKRYFERHPLQKIKRRAIKRKQAASEKSKDTLKRWLEENPELVREKQHRYYLKNKEKIKKVVKINKVKRQLNEFINQEI